MINTKLLASEHNKYPRKMCAKSKFWNGKLFAMWKEEKIYAFSLVWHPRVAVFLQKGEQLKMKIILIWEKRKIAHRSNRHSELKVSIG
jgi:hypothetical protein